MKSYLDGLDYIAAYLNHTCRNTPGRENTFLLGLELNGQPDPRRLSDALQRQSALFPILNGRMARQRIHLAPFWKNGPSIPPPIDTGIFTEHAAEQFANEPMPEHTHLRVRVLTRGTGKSVLLFQFSHLLFDGRGAELFLKRLRDGECAEQPTDASDAAIVGSSSPRLNEWKRQFTAGKTVQRRMIAAARAGAIAGTPTAEQARNRFALLRFNEEETARIQAESDRTAGPFLLTCHLLAKAAKCHAQLLDRNGINGNLLIPMSVDRRGTDRIPRERIFLNNWSFLPLLLNREKIRNPEEGASEVRRELFDCTEMRIADSYRAAARLMRIAPFSLLDRIFRRIGPSAHGTLMFSFLSTCALDGTDFLGCPVENLYHLPSMPPMTGIGIFFNAYQNKLNLTLSWREGIFPEPETERLIRELSHEYL